MRNIEKNKKLQDIAQQEKLQIDVRQLDITEDDAVNYVVERVLKDYEKIDVLINNAGAGFLGTLEQTTMAQAQSIMNTNFFGVWRLTQAILPNMRAHKSGHIISITSIGGVVGQPFNDAYCAAKFAVEGLMESLAPVVARLGIHISLVEPGPVNSEFVATALCAAPDLKIEIKKDYQEMLNSYLSATKESFMEFGQSPDSIAKILLDIASAHQPHFRYQTSDLSKHISSLKFSDITGNMGIKLSGSRLPT